MALRHRPGSLYAAATLEGRRALERCIMPIVHGPIRPRLEHHSEVAFPTAVISFDEAERHLRRLKRLPCGCMTYGGFSTRPTTNIWLADGSTAKISVGRLMATLSADRPLGPKDFACHSCDNPICGNPDHLTVGSASSNGRDKFRPGRPIRERIAARFYDEALEQIAAALPPPVVPIRKAGRPIGYRPDPKVMVPISTMSAMAKAVDRSLASRL